MLDEWVHIPTPGDHYSPKTGSAVITVIREITRCHHAAGGRSQVLVAPGTWDGFDDGARREVPFRRLGTPSPQAKIFDRTIGGILGRRLLSGLPYTDAADALGRDFDGLIFVHNEPAGVEVIVRRCPNAKVCLWVQNELFSTYTKRQARRVISYSYRIICCSEFIAKRLQKITGRDSRIAVVLNGVNTEQFVPAVPRPRNDPPIILFLGRMVPEKGPHILLRAAILLKTEGVRFRLRMVGSTNFNSLDPLSDFEESLRELAAEAKDYVEFKPFRPRAEVVQEFQSADIFCVPSNWDDPCPLTVLEGMACGLIIVASRRGGIPEEAGLAALYFDPPDHHGLARQLAMVLAECSNSSGSQSRRSHSRATAEQLSWQSQFERLQRVIG